MKILICSFIFALIFLSVKNSHTQIIRFAAIGDYGWDERNTSAPNDSGAKKVANFRYPIISNTESILPL